MPLLDKLMFWKPRAEAGAPPRFTVPLAPESPLFVIGDVHGCAGLLGSLLSRIGWPDLPEGAVLVLLGDYVDRGEESRAVLDLVAGLAAQAPGRVVTLRGNHEQMMLDFLDHPAERGPRWLRNGGLQTLASYGIGGLSESSEGAALETAANRLAAALGRERQDWLRALPLQWRSGNVHMVHAAADPALPMEAQEARVLLWGRGEFFRTPRSDGNWIVHGHTVVKEPLARNGRIAVDTGAVYTGRLTAAAIEAGKVEFISL